MTQISELAISLPVLLFSVVVHECAHGWTAGKFGDHTARIMGRLTLNPLPHIDPFWTVILPVLLALLKLPIIALAKPVPVNFQNLRNPKKNILWVGISGPVVNILMAIISGLLLRVSFIFSVVPVRYALDFGVQINVILAVFNMIPIPPLDGSRFVYSLLPNRFAHYYRGLERYGIFILLIMMSTGTLYIFINPLYKSVMFVFHLFGIL